MEQSIKVNGEMVSEMVMAYRYGQMEADMKAFGVRIRPMARAS